MGKINYLARSIVRSLDEARLKCPNCGSSASCVVDRKYVLTKLRRCVDCGLLFRTPTDNLEENAKFYEKSYSQGFTTRLPNREELDELRRSNFAGSEKDYRYYVDSLQRIGIKPGARIFDFGCSWGYGTYQFGQAGLEATAFEVAISRRTYAERELGVSVVRDMREAIADPTHCQSYDCFFSAHVLEHVPTPQHAFAFALNLLKPGGIFVSFTPNGSDPCRKALPAWSRLWGEVHPTFIDNIFLDRSFANSPRAFGSSPLEDLRLPACAEAVRLDDLSRPELFFAARKVGNRW
ncbi:MAG: class I SAM-dependent methyltransferase [Bauldia sp.]